MKKKIRFLLCALAIIIGSAGARAQNTKEISRSEDLQNACNGRLYTNVESFILMADIETSQPFEVNRSLTLDLNGHSITTSGDYCFDIFSGNTLTIIDNSTGQTKGSINCTGEGIGDAIEIKSGGALNASGISITAQNGTAVNNSGSTATLSDCTISGNGGISNGGTTTITGCSISGNDTAIKNENGTLSINMGDNPSACTISGGGSGIYNQLDGTVAIGSGVSIKSCSDGGITNAGGTVTLNAWPAFGTGDDKNGRDIKLLKGEKIAIGANITAAPAAPITVRVTDLDDNDLGATDLPYTITTGYAAHVKDAQSAVISPASVFAYYTDTPGYTFALGGSNDSEAVLTGDPSDPPIGFDVTDLLAPTYTEGTDAEWTFTMPDYNVKAEVEYFTPYFSITRNAGQTDETVSYFATLAEAVEAAALGEDIVQLADYETADMVTIDKFVKLNLNGHTYTSTNTTAAITVAESVSFHLNCNINDKDINGTLTNSSTTGGKGIIVEYGGNLNAEYVSIVSASDDAIYNKGFADFYTSSIAGKRGIYDESESYFTNTSISATDYGIYEAGFDVVFNSGTSISGCSKAGVFCSGDDVCFRGMPTFGSGDNANGTDIWLANGSHIEFGSYFTYTAAPKITVRVTDSEGTALETTDLPLTITANYANYFTDESGMIDPNTVFAWYDKTQPVGFGFDGSGDVCIGTGVACVTLPDADTGVKTTFYDDLFMAINNAIWGYVAGDSETPKFVPTVTILADIEPGGSGYTLSNNNNPCELVLNLNGHSISGPASPVLYVKNGVSLTIEDSGEDGRIESSVGLAIWNQGSLTLNGGTITSLGDCIINEGDLTIAGGTINANTYGYGINSQGVLTLKTLPTFVHGDYTYYSDISLSEGKKITFSAGSYDFPDNPIVVKYNGTVPYTFTEGYSTYVKVEGVGVINPQISFIPDDYEIGYVIDFDAEEKELVISRPHVTVTLYNDSENEDYIRNFQYSDVTLAGRVMTKDGTWNTLCLPFDVTIAGSPLDGAVAKTLDAENSYLDNDRALNLVFGAAVSKIEAGKPYIIKWEPNDDPDLTENDLVFNGVIMTEVTPIPIEFDNSFGDDCIFVGQYSPFQISDESSAYGLYPNMGHLNEILFLATATDPIRTVLGYSANPRTLRACRAHFYVPASASSPDPTSNGVRSVVLDFGDGTETAITVLRLDDETSDPASTGYYTLDGRKLSAKPAAKGLYSHNGKKIIIK